jgi:hypothetical protein
MHTIDIHPGAVLRDELEERGLSQRQLAVHILAALDMARNFLRCRSSRTRRSGYPVAVGPLWVPSKAFECSCLAAS